MIEVPEALGLPEQQRGRRTLEPFGAATSDERLAAFCRLQKSVERGSFYPTGKFPARDELPQRRGL